MRPIRFVLWMFLLAALCFWLARTLSAADAQHLASSQPQPDGSFLYQLLVSVGLLASVTGNLIMIFRGAKAQKREVTFGQESVTVDMFRQANKATEDRITRLEKDFCGMRDEMREELSKINTSDEQRASRIHDRIDELGTALSSQVGEMRGQLIRIKGS